VDIVAAEFRMRFAIAIVERERFRRVGYCLVDDIGRKQNSHTTVDCFQTVVEHSLAHAFTANFHAGFCHDAFGFIKDFSDEVIAQDV
jgi:hypothetical protein